MPYYPPASGSSSGTDPVGVPPGGRLTTESGVPVGTSDRTSQSTIYYTPHLHNRIGLYGGSGWTLYTFTERSLALSGLTSGKNYDVFLYDNAGALTLELSAAWTNDTTRANALTTVDGVLVKSGATTRRYLGTIRTTGTTTTEDSGGGVTTQVGGKRFVWNAHNQVPRPLRVIDTTDTWSYTTDTVRQANGAGGNKVEYVTGDGSLVAVAGVTAQVFLQSNSTRGAKSGVGVDSTTAFSGLVASGFNQVATAGVTIPLTGGRYVGAPGLGYHYLAWCEKGADGTCLFTGDNTGDGTQCGIAAVIMG